MKCNVKNVNLVCYVTLTPPNHFSHEWLQTHDLGLPYEGFLNKQNSFISVSRILPNFPWNQLCTCTYVLFVQNSISRFNFLIKFL